MMAPAWTALLVPAKLGLWMVLGEGWGWKRVEHLRSYNTTLIDIWTFKCLPFNFNGVSSVSPFTQQARQKKHTMDNDMINHDKPVKTLHHHLLVPVRKVNGNSKLWNLHLGASWSEWHSQLSLFCGLDRSVIRYIRRSRQWPAKKGSVSQQPSIYISCIGVDAWKPRWIHLEFWYVLVKANQQQLHSTALKAPWNCN